MKNQDLGDAERAAYWQGYSEGMIAAIYALHEEAKPDQSSPDTEDVGSMEDDWPYLASPMEVVRDLERQLAEARNGHGT